MIQHNQSDIIKNDLKYFTSKLFGLFTIYTRIYQFYSCCNTFFGGVGCHFENYNYTFIHT